jgi:hypothetical protein
MNRDADDHPEKESDLPQAPKSRFQLDVDYNGTGTSSMTWAELRDLIDLLPQEDLKRPAMVCSEPPSGKNPYTVQGLMTKLDGWGPIMVQEY